MRVAKLVAALLCLGGGVFAASLDPTQAISQYVHDNWKTENGLPQDSVLSISQTPDGYLWVGTEVGLARFDGVRFVTFNTRNTPAFSTNEVDALLVDQRGNLWIGMRGGGLVVYSHGSFFSAKQQATAPDGLRAFLKLAADHAELSSGSITALYEDSAGVLWAGTDGAGVIALADGRFRAYTRKQGLADDTVFALAADRHGGLYIGTHGGLSHLSGGRFPNETRISNQTRKDGLPDDDIRSVLVDHAGGLWIGTSKNGLLQVDVSGLKTTYTANSGLSGNQIWCIKEDSGNSIWVGSNSGVTRIYPEGKSHASISRFGSKDGLPGDNTFAIFEDREASLWVGTVGGGLNRFRQGSVSTMGQAEGLASDTVLPVYEDSEGVLWIGTYNAGVNSIRDGKISHYTSRNGLADDEVFSVAEDGEGDHWFGTRRGLSRLHDGRITFFGPGTGAPENAVHCTYVDSKGHLWAGSRGGLTYFDGKRFTTYTTQNGLSNNNVFSIYEDPVTRTIWLGTGGGLNKLSNGSFQVFKKGVNAQSNEPSNDIIFSITGDRDGVLWLGTGGGGVNRFKDGRFTVISTRDGLADDAIFQILDDHHGWLWFSSYHGIFSVAKDELAAFAAHTVGKVSSRTLGMSDGMRTVECNGGFQPAGTRLRDGRLVFPTMKGTATVQVGHLAAATIPPPVVLENVTIDDQEMAANGTVRPPPGNGRLELQYTALSFITPEKIRFKYMLEGFDKDWVEAGPRRTAYYTNIPPGSYRFRVIARNADGIWSRQEAAVSIDLPPHFYQTLPFRVLEFLIVIGLVAAAYGMRVRQMRMREQKLVALVEDRTRELSGSEKKFRQLAENINEVFWMMDPGSGALLYVSPAFDNIWGFPASKVLADPATWFAGVHPDDRDAISNIRQRQRNGKMIECEYRIVQNEVVRWVSDRAFPIHDHFGRLDRIVGVVEDITERKEAEEVLRLSNHELEKRVSERTGELIRLNEELQRENEERRRTEAQLKAAKEAAEAANRAKTEFLNNMSHELRTPMNGVLGMTRLALGTELNEDQKEYLETANSSATSLLNLIDDILDFSDVEASKISLREVSFRPRDCIQRTVEALAHKAAEKNLPLLSFVTDDVPETLLGDPERLHQILSNLVGNAIKFTSAGHVSISASAANTSDSEVTLKFCVADTGKGIPKASTAMIFEPFTQVDGSNTREAGGTGLGLSICSRLVKMMRGTIWVKSEEGQGSSFYFTANFKASAAVAVKPPPLASFEEHAQDGRGVRRPAERASEFLSSLAERSRALCASKEHAQNGPVEAARVPDAVSQHERALCAFEENAQDGRIEAARVPDAVSQHERALCAFEENAQDGRIEAARVPDAVSRHERALCALNILLVEDNVVNQRVALRLLQKFGHNVTVAANGREALSTLANQERPFDVVFMDVQMPEMDGLETTREIRRREKPTGDHLPIIALTAHAMKTDEESCFEAGMDKYLTKPVQADLVLEALRDISTLKACRQ